MTIRARLSLLTAGVAAVILAALVSVITLTARDRLTEEALTDLREVTSLTAGKIAQWEDTITASAQAVTLNPGFRAMREPVHRDALAGLYAAIERYAYAAHSLDATGNVFMLHTGERDDRYFGDRYYFQEAMRGSRITRDVILDRSVDPPRPAIAFGFPIIGVGAAQVPTGALMVSASLDTAADIASEASAGGGRVSFVLDENERLVAHSGMEVVSGGELVDYSDFPLVAMSREAARADSGGTPDVFRYTSNGRRWIGDRIRLDSGWTVYVARDAARVTATARALTTQGMVGSIIAIVVLTAMIAFTTGATLRPINTLGERLEQYAQGAGDLTSRLKVRRGDELGDAAVHFNAFVDTLHDLVRGVQQSVGEASTRKTELETNAQETADATNDISETVKTMTGQMKTLYAKTQEADEASDEIARYASNLTGRVDDQVAAVEQSSSSIEQMVASIRNVGETARRQESSLGDLESVTARGREEIEATHRTVQEMGGSVQELQQAISMINDIADQTNVLAMNASIEAANAGSYGRGFGVVAAEIRKLAVQSAENAQSIGSTLTRNAERIDRLGRFADNANEHYGTLEHQLQTLRRAFDEIINAMNELTVGTEEITNAVSSLREVSTSVEQVGADISERSARIKRQMSEVTDVSAQTWNGVKEIDGGTWEINTAMGELGTAVSRIAEIITEISHRVDQFETRGS